MRRRRRRFRPLEGTAHAIYRALCQAGLTDQARRMRIAHCYADAVGPEIAGRTEPQSFRRGVLTLKAASPTWQNELMFLRASIVARLNEALGKRWVIELRVVSGSMTPVAPRPRPEAKAPSPTAEDRAAGQSLAAPIEDNDIRAAFAALVARGRLTARSRDP